MDSWIFSVWADLSGLIALAMGIVLGAFRHYCKTWDRWEKNHTITLLLHNNRSDQVANIRRFLFKVPILWRKPRFQLLSLATVSVLSLFAALVLTDDIIFFLNPHIDIHLFRRYYFLCFLAILALRIRASIYLGNEFFNNGKDKIIMEYMGSLNR